MEMLLCHLVGDYVLQSDWMATEKTKRSLPALVHALMYTLPFLLLTQVWWQLALIASTHFVIDRWRLARYVCWAKNFLAPKYIETTTQGILTTRGLLGYSNVWKRNHPWADCAATGYHKDRPAWLTVWLLIITDNTMHLVCNYFILEYAIWLVGT